MMCSRVFPMLSRLLDQELSPWETAEVESHLSECGACRTLLREWKLQGFHLRTHLRRLALGEDFVRKVMDSESLRASVRGRSHVRAAERPNLVRWVPAAAAIFVAVLILSPFLPNRESIGYARVLDPGGSLEVLPPSSSVWVRTSAGELLRPGDWLRNPVSGAAEILWKDCCRLSIEPGTLTHFPDAQAEAPDEVVLLNGSLSTDISAGKRDFQVRTPAGAVTATGGRFAVGVRDWALPQLQVLSDRSEIMTGTILPVGKVSVDDGRVRVSAAHEFFEVRTAETAYFTTALFGSVAMRPGAMEAAVSASAGPMEKGELLVSLTSAEDGLRIRVTARKITLKRLLESATGIEVRGGEEVMVTGKLNFLAGATPESVAAAIGHAVGVPIAFGHEAVRRAAALAQQDRRPAPDWVQGEFRLEKSSEGRISFEFHNVPAGEALRILRTSAPDVPTISPESGPIPISVQGTGLSSQEVAAWIEKKLGLRFVTVDHQADVIEVDGSAPVPPTDREGIRLSSRPARAVSVRGSESQRACADFGTGSGESGGSLRPPLPGNEIMTIAPVAPAAQPPTAAVWGLLERNMKIPGVGAISLSVSEAQVQTGKVKAKAKEYFSDQSAASRPKASAYLIWPALGEQDADETGAAYLVRNTLGLSAHTVWNGYDREGQLIAQYAIVVLPSSTLALLPLRDLPAALGEGGHWETLSDIPVAASRDVDESGRSAVGLPIEAERLNSQWSFPAGWLTRLAGRVWIVNPGTELADVELVILRGGRLVFSERLILPSHGSVIWPEAFSGIKPATIGSSGDMLVRIAARQGRVAAGLAR